MTRSSDMKQLGEEIVLGLRDRLELLKETREYTRRLLAKFESERREMYQQLRQMLDDDRQQRAEFLAEFLGELRQENARTRETWREILEELRRIREQGGSG
ncbi:MAG: hypothetical protein AB1426_07915 [Bacillota bacterium]